MSILIRSNTAQLLSVEYMQSINQLMQSSQPNDQKTLEKLSESTLDNTFEEIVLETDHSQEEEIEIVEEIDDSEPSNEVAYESVHSSQGEKKQVGICWQFEPFYWPVG